MGFCRGATPGDSDQESARDPTDRPSVPTGARASSDVLDRLARDGTGCGKRAGTLSGKMSLRSKHPRLPANRASKQPKRAEWNGTVFGQPGT